MRFAQRTVLLVGFFLLIVWFMFYVTGDNEEYFVKKWETVYVDRFTDNLCRNGRITYEDYILVHNSLSCFGSKIEIRMDEYKTEQDMDKNTYYVPVIWEEIRECLWEDESYYFTPGSIVRIVVTRESATRERKFSRVGRINERVDNGT